MSSVVIAGNTSGSVTLDAPAVAGTTVLTLPTTNGTLITTGTTTGISGSAISTGTVGVSVGGTGQTTATAAFNALSPITTTGDLIVGNGSNSATRLAIGSNNTVLTSNGTTATWAAAAGGQFQTELFTAPGTWTKPASCTQVRVTVIGGGGGGSPLGNAGFGGIAIAANVPVSAPVTVTVGAGGPGGGSGGTSSFGPLVSATGGAASVNPGTGTISSGTTIRNSGINGPGNANYPDQGYQFIGVVGGGKVNTTPSSPVLAYSATSVRVAGASGSNDTGRTGTGGAIVVEFVG
jgi:hypothetical protein